MSVTIPFSQACERNKFPILEILIDHFKEVNSVLEIGSGTGQHAIYFAKNMPQLIWQTSDQNENLNGIQAQLKNCDVGNALLPISLDVSQKNWNVNSQIYDAVFSANTLHIMSMEKVQQFFEGLNAVTKSGSILAIYGPFKYNGEFTSESNMQFNQSLISRGVGSGIRDFEEIDCLASTQGFSLQHDYPMPSNNQCIIWQNN